MRKIVIPFMLFFVILFATKLTVFAAEIPMTPGEESSSTTIDKDEDYTIIVENLIVGEEYTITYTLIDPNDNHKIIKKTEYFTPDSEPYKFTLHIDKTEYNTDTVIVYPQLEGPKKETSSKYDINSSLELKDHYDSLEDFLNDIHEQQPLLYMMMTTTFAITMILIIFKVIKMIIRNSYYGGYSFSTHSHDDDDNDKEENTVNIEIKTDEKEAVEITINNKSENLNKDKDCYDLDDNTHMFKCKSCGQKFIIQDTFEGFIPQCPRCGDIL